MEFVCEFFGNALERLPTFPSKGKESIATTIGPAVLPTCPPMTYNIVIDPSNTLPDWATFNPSTRMFTATFPNENATYVFIISVTTEHGTVLMTSQEAVILAIEIDQNTLEPVSSTDPIV